MFCAATLTGLWRQSSTAMLREVNGGQTTTSGPDSVTCGRNSARNASVSSVVLCIFQLAARYVIRSGISQRLDSGELSTLHQLERGAATGREPVDGTREPEALQRRDGVTAAHDGVPGSRRHRLGDRAGPAREGLELEGPHGAVPEDGSRAGDPLVEVGDRVAADVEAHPALRHVDTVQESHLCVRVELPAEAEILGQLEHRVAALRLLQDLARRLHPLLLHERVPGVPALRLEEAEAHRTADQDLF